MGSGCNTDRHPTSSNNRAKNLKLFLCVIALGTLLASPAYPQVLAGTVLLPDSLGPLTGKTHVVFDENPEHPRMFIGSEDGDVLVLDAITCRRIARIPTGPVASICYSSKQDKLYTSTMEGYTIEVADCGSYQVVKELQFSEYVNGLFYNPVVDRVYCGAFRMKVIDCAADSILGTLDVNGMSACFAFDSEHNELFIGAGDALRILDCDRDSVVASFPELRAPKAICFQPSVWKVYVAAGESLFALSVKTDSIVYRRHYDTLNPLLASDPVHNRVYYAYQDHIVALNCADDSIIWTQYPWTTTIAMAAEPEQDKLYAMVYGLRVGCAGVLDGATGSQLSHYPNSQDSSLYYCAAANRWFIMWNGGEVTASDSRSDTIVGVSPLAAHISYVCADSVDNKLYFSAGKSGIGVVDCSSNKVTSYVRPCYVPYGYGDILPQCMAINSRDRKLYYGGDSGIFVLDCVTDSVVKMIPVQGWVQTLDWHPVFDKLYAIERIWHSGKYVTAVIDCVRDTVARYIPLNDSGRWIDNCHTLFAPAFDWLWLFGADRYAVVDCATDSVIEDTTAGRMRGLEFTAYSPADQKIFGTQYRGLCVFDVESRLPVDSIIFFSHEANPSPLYVATEARKLYWNVWPSVLPFVDSLAVVDTRTDGITNVLFVPFQVMRICGDRTGDYVYIAGRDWNTLDGHLAVIDTRSDSIVSSVAIPVLAQFLERNSKTNRLYVAGWADSVIQVVYDSVIFAGLQARPLDVTLPRRLQTLLSRGTPLRSPADVSIFDASGRRAAVLRSGLNDVSHLAPGVYFVREEPQAADLKPQAVRKVVVTR